MSISSAVSELIYMRRATIEQVEDAELIYNEVQKAIVENYPTELAKSGTEGYMSEVGSPHDWWMENSQAYRSLSKKYTNDRKFYTVCLISQALIEEFLEKLKN